MDLYISEKFHLLATDLDAFVELLQNDQLGSHRLLDILFPECKNTQRTMPACAALCTLGSWMNSVDLQLEYPFQMISRSFNCSRSPEVVFNQCHILQARVQTTAYTKLTVLIIEIDFSFLDRLLCNSSREVSMIYADSMDLC